MPENYPEAVQNTAATFDNKYTVSDAESSERVMHPRGDTPLPTLDVSDIPQQYELTRADEYAQLRRRGATQLMCTTFQLSFTMATGIVATLTPEIKGTFGGPEMKSDDSWKLHLGRTVHLSATDRDGSEFIEGLLEDILLFSGSHFQQRTRDWKTICSAPGSNIWVTRPTFSMDSEDAAMSGEEEIEISDTATTSSEEVEYLISAYELDDLALVRPFVEHGPTLHRDEYEVTDVEDLESDDDGDSDVADLGYGINPRYDDANWSDGDDDGLYGSGQDDADATRSADATAARVLESMTMSGPSQAGPSNAVALEDEVEEDSPAGSDFDSGEVLSGDEEVLGAGRTRTHPG